MTGSMRLPSLQPGMPTARHGGFTSRPRSKAPAYVRAPAASGDRFRRLVRATVTYAARTLLPMLRASARWTLLLAVASRSSYLALMIERPQVLDRVIDPPPPATGHCATSRGTHCC